MTRSTAIQIQNKFIRGLITENTALSFPKDACTETFDCVFDYTGRIHRRLGFDLESNYVTSNTFTPASTDVWSEYLWKNIGGDSDKTFVVQQVGGVIYFYDVSTSTDIGTNVDATGTITLSDYLVTNSTLDPSTLECQYAEGRGKLLIVNKAVDPLLVEYDIETGIFTVTAIIVEFRDFQGVEDGLGLTERPTSSVAALITSNPSHYYNILNQGWAITDALSQWDTGLTTLPSNADMVAYYRNTVADSFAAANVGQADPGNTPAIKGHFILKAGGIDRTAALADDGFGSVTVPGGATQIAASAGTIIGNYTSGSQAFDDDLTKTVATAATGAGDTGYIGKDWGASDTHTIGRVLVVGSSDAAFFSGYSGNVTIDVYGNAALPASRTDGTVIGTKTFADSSSGFDEYVSIDVTDQTTAYRYHWVTVSRDPTPTSASASVAEIRFYLPSASFARPRCTTFFAGRAWYAGIDTEEEADNLYFSQIILDDNQFGRCYQQNDPTSEQIPDLLESDGGVLRIPEMGTIHRLVPFQGQLLVLATNGVWLVKGGGGGFRATDYQVRRSTNIGVNSPYSVVDVAGAPLWWAEDGIYTVEYDPNYDSVAVKSLTEESIKTFYNEIPQVNRKFVKGCYNRYDDTVFWVYNDTASLASSDYYIYDSVLCMNTKTRAFYPWTIGTSGTNSPDVRGVLFVQPADRVSDPQVIFPLSYTISATSYLNFAGVINTSYKDWTEYATTVTATGADELDYTSYFHTGYEINSELMKFNQANYIETFLETVTNASLTVRALWGFSNSSSSNVWSTAQQCYSSLTTKGRSYYDVKSRRLKIRGKGKALQFKFSSETGKPFTAIGWAYFATANDNI